MIRGKVKWYNPEKGFGFVIRDDGGPDAFLGSAALNAAGIRHVFDGDRIEFLLEQDRHGRERCAEIRVIATSTGGAI
jgi:CspA family cold shock protein